MLCNDIMLRGDVSVLNRGNANGSRTQCVLLVTVTTQRGGQQHYPELFTENKATKMQPFCLWAYCFNFNFSVREKYIYCISWHFSYQVSFHTHAVCSVLLSCSVPITVVTDFDVFLNVHHSIVLFHLPTLMHNSLFINNMYVTL